MIDVELRKRGSSAELVISGRIDSNTTKALEKKLMEQAQRFESLILDFGGVSYISSAGLRTLRLLHKQMNAKGGTLQIVNVRKDVMDIFQVTGFIYLLNDDDK